MQSHTARRIHLLSLRCLSLPNQLMRPMTSSINGVRLVLDKPECLMDDDIIVKVTGLSPNDRVTVIATTEQKENLFWSHGLFRANDRGVVDLSEDTSINGSYNGLRDLDYYIKGRKRDLEKKQPQGGPRRFTFTSMMPAPWLPSHLRMFQPRAIKPRIITFNVFPESDRPWEYLKDKTKVLASVEHQRWYKSASTRRIPIDHPRIQGTLFLPEGPGPFPGVIDMYGSLVTIVEGRAALLASRGFATLSLSDIHGKGLPQSLKEIDLGYFEEAGKWFASLPEVRLDGLGVLSSSLGGAVGLWMAQNIPNIRAVVSINGIPFGCQFWTYNGLDAGYQTSIDDTRFQMGHEALLAKNVFSFTEGSFLKPWIHGANLLVILGEDDLMIKTEHNVRLFELMPPDYRNNKAELVVYPGAGHLIDAPNTPLSRAVEAADLAQATCNVVKRKYQHKFRVFSAWNHGSPMHYVLDIQGFQSPTLSTTLEYVIAKLKAGSDNLIFSGGYPKEHAAAQSGAWQLLLEFFKKHLF